MTLEQSNDLSRLRSVTSSLSATQVQSETAQDELTERQDQTDEKIIELLAVEVRSIINLNEQLMRMKLTLR